MRNILRALAASAITASLAAAGQKGDAQELGLLGILFVGFAALILVGQFIPAIALFVSMLRGLFSTAPRASTRTGREPQKTA
jgi:hypothetical protein